MRDTDYVQTTFNAVLSATGKQIPITAVVLNGVTQGWNIATTSSNSSYSPLPGQSPTDATSASYFQVNLKRADVIRAYVVLTAIVSWAVTAACVGTAIQVCVWGRDVALPVILLMATVLFALPTLRATNPGIPEVGCLLDVLSFLIQEIVRSIYMRTRVADAHSSSLSVCALPCSFTWLASVMSDTRCNTPLNRTTTPASLTSRLRRSASLLSLSSSNVKAKLICAWTMDASEGKAFARQAARTLRFLFRSHSHCSILITWCHEYMSHIAHSSVLDSRRPSRSSILS